MGTLVLAGRYEILEKIGDGGMAVVYKARDKQLNRFIAVKILRKEYIADQTFVENFIREAKAAASLLHPNIVTIHDAGKDRDIYYIVMEYIEGRPLSDVIAAEAPLDYKRCIRIAKQIASALSLAHRNNIIHRDVKPHNILMTGDDTAKITDFGIAKAVSDGTIINDSGVIMGSVHYFSPEQSRGQYVDEKSDIYSLGIVLYEMITGRVPFDADNPVTIAVMHMNEPIIPPSHLVKRVPPGLEQIVLKATAKFQSDRFGNIDEMYKSLDNVNFITGIIDDPEIALFVKPSVTEDSVSRGYSNAAGPDEPEYDEPIDDYDDADVPVYKPPERKMAGYSDPDDYDDYEDDYDDEDEDERERKGGFFSGLFGGRAAAKAADRDDYDDDRDDKPQGKLSKKQKMILVIAVIAIAVALSFPLSKAIMGMFNYEPVEVPDVVGMYVEEAIDILNAKDFSVEIKTVPLPRVENPFGDDLLDDATGFTDEDLPGSSRAPVYEPEFREGQVMEQDPEGGDMVKPGSKVTLTVAGPPEEPGGDDDDALSTELREVPGVVGKSKASAEYAITAAGFRTGLTNYENSDMPVDTVILQSPKEGERAPGNSTISITISLGPKELTTKVPKLVGKTFEEASQLAASGKFKLEVSSTQYSKDVKKDAIISSSPEEGATIKEGSTVRVVVSLGPGGVTGVTVSGPASIEAGQSGSFTATVSGEGEYTNDVTWEISGQTRGGTKISATGTLTVASNESAGSITVQATSRMDPTKSGSTTVSITVPAPPKYTLTVVNGNSSGSYTAGTAVSITANAAPAGYEFDSWSSSGGGSFGNANKVTTTFTMPAGNVTVTANYRLIPPVMVTVPDVINIPEADAINAIVAAGLSYGGSTSQTCGDGHDVGSVCGTNPGVGTSVPIGTTVTLIISLGP